jgi:signal transduction histidine kinase
MRATNTLSGLDKKRLRRWLVVFFLALAVPTAILIYQAYSQLKWEAFHQNRLLAEELAARIDSSLVRLIRQEEVRSFSDYSFLVVAGDPKTNIVQRSPLSSYPVDSGIPGLIGYFQVDAEGRFSTPFLPKELSKEPPKLISQDIANPYGISQHQYQQRVALQRQIQQILSENRLVHDEVAETTAAVSSQFRRDRQFRLAGSDVLAKKNEAGAVAPRSSASFPKEEQEQPQAAFDQLKESSVDKGRQKTQEIMNNLGRVEDLKLEKRYQNESQAKSSRQILSRRAPLLEKRGSRKEQSSIPEPLVSSEPATLSKTKPKSQTALRIRTFESEVDPFEFSLLGSGHFVMFRKVWRDGQRFIQGAIIEQKAFLQGSMEAMFREAAIAQVSNLIVAYQGNVISAFNGWSARSYLSRADELTGQLLYQGRLSAPLSDIELIFSVTRLPPGPGGAVINWVAAILLLVLCGGFYLMYRLGVRQIELGRQQQDFVSAVSHELKTPLTSIRMYGEMLREGWANDDKKKEYYDYIYNESERLSRLINNVLQLARMTRNELHVNLKPIAVSELMDELRSKVSTQIEQAGFKLNLQCCEDVSQYRVKVDEDYFTQIWWTTPLNFPLKQLPKL